MAAGSETGGLSVVREDVDLRSQVDQVVAADPVLVARAVCVIAGEDAVATADGARVRQILRNLLGNASRYGGPTIEVGIERHNGSIRLWVADDGPGIAAGDRDRIFEPFERGHHLPGVPASVGLGLTVSRQLARAMGGELVYRDEGRTCLELVLPASGGFATPV